MDAVGCFESDQKEDEDDDYNDEIEAEEECCKQVRGVSCSWLLEPEGLSRSLRDPDTMGICRHKYDAVWVVSYDHRTKQTDSLCEGLKSCLRH